MSDEQVAHPQHYGGDTTYETIKVVEAWNLGFRLGNAVKYISRAGKKGGTDAATHIRDLEKAAWYLNREIAQRKAAYAADREEQDSLNHGFSMDQRITYTGKIQKIGEQPAPSELPVFSVGDEIRDADDERWVLCEDGWYFEDTDGYREKHTFQRILQWAPLTVTAGPYKGIVIPK